MQHPLRTIWSRRAELASALAVLVAFLLALLAGGATGSRAAGDPHAAHQHVDTARITAANADPAPARAWSDPAAWGGQVPADGTAVTIPAGQVVVLDRDVTLANLTIQGTLRFARRDLTLAADWISIEGGTLEVGTEQDPFLQRATIRLLDRTPGEEHGHLGDRFIGLTDARLELHGEPRRSWTRLARTAPAGAATITLAAVDSWRAGDRIAIASTDFDPGQAEERTVRAVSGSTLTLDRPLRYTHFGVRQRIAGRWVDERAEVALLTRNVTVEASDDAEQRRFGGQVMAMGASTMHLEHTEFTRMGQEGILLRYPIHFHVMRGAGAGSYVRNSSIHRSWNRCLTIHGTDSVQATGNACYDHVGHGYFLEDGAERANTITGNLGFGTHRPRRGLAILKSDERPATFWITNPDNTVLGNVAAGSEGHGIWMALPEHPTGLFTRIWPQDAAAIWPRRTRVRAFAGNVAHSNDGNGLHVDDGPRPDSSTEATWHEAHADPADPKSAVVVTTFSGLVAWKNRDHGAWLRGRAARLVGATLADNAIGATFASTDTYLRGSLVVGTTANVGTPQPWERQQGQVGPGGRSLPRPWQPEFPVRGFEFYDGQVGVERTTFANFLPWRDARGRLRQQSALGYLLDDDFSVHPRNFTRALRFVRARRVFLERPQVGHDGDVSAAFLDQDGSVTGRAGRTLVTRNPFLYGSGCRLRTAFNAVECTGTYASLIVGAPGTPEAVHPVRITRPDGATQTLTASGGGKQGDEAVTTILADSTYRVAFNGGTPARTKYVLYQGRDRTVTIAIPHDPSFRVLRYGCDVSQRRSWCFGQATSREALDATDHASYFYDAAAGTLYLRLVSTGTDWDELEVQ